MATQTVGSYDLTHQLIEEEGRISQDIYRRTIDSSVWLKLVRQTSWPDEMGDTLSVLTYERTLPSTGNTWNAITSDSNKYAIPDAVEVPVAQSARTFGLEHTAVFSDPIVVNDLRMSFRFREQLKNIYENLVDNVSYIWKNRYRDQYEATAEHKMVAYLTASNQALVEDNSSMPVRDGDSGELVANKIGRLTQGILNRVYQGLIQDGGGMGAMGNESGRPIFTLITSAETSENLMTQEDIKTRESFLYNNSRVSELLAPLGVERSFKGFYHVIDPFPKRFTFTEGTPGSWTEVPAYIEDTSSYPEKQGSQNRNIVNPAWQVAEFEDSYVFHTEVFESLIPSPITSAGQGTTFDPVSYRGDFRFLNIKDLATNPDGSWGKFRGVLANGAKPVHPEFGYVIRHRRVDANFSMLDADGSAIAYS